MSFSRLQIMRNTLAVSLFSALSLLITFVLQLVLAKKFGIAAEMDAYYTAAVVPAFAVRIFILPLTSVFIPLYKNCPSQERPSFYALIFWSFSLFFLLIGLLISALASPLTELIIPGAGALTSLLTIKIFRVIGLFTFFNGLFFLTQTLHLAENRFFLPYFSQVLSQVLTLVFTLLFLSRLGILAAAYGILVGFAFGSIVNLTRLPQTITSFSTANLAQLRPFLALYLPFALGSLIFRSTPLIDRYFASLLPAGEIAVLGYGGRILEGLTTLFSTGLAVVSLPLSAQLSAAKNHRRLASLLTTNLVWLGFLLLPIIVYLAILNQPLVQLIFERGSFTSASTTKVAAVMTAYLGALFALTAGNQLVNILYAQKRHLLVVATNLSLLPGYILSVSLLSRLQGSRGIALSYSGLTLLTIFVYALFIRPELTIPWTTIFRRYLRYSLSALLSGGLVILFLLIMPALSLFLTLTLSALIGSFFYLAFLVAMNNQEAVLLLKTITRRPGDD